MQENLASRTGQEPVHEPKFTVWFIKLGQFMESQFVLFPNKLATNLTNCPLVCRVHAQKCTCEVFKCLPHPLPSC